MSSGRRIVFWRHGRTEWNAQRRFQGQSDIPLDNVGLGQASEAAKLLADLQPSRIISSDLVRASRTAQALSELTNIEVATFEGLRETHAGTWEGLTRDVLVANYGDELAAWDVLICEKLGYGNDLCRTAKKNEAFELNDHVPGAQSFHEALLGERAHHSGLKVLPREHVANHRHAGVLVNKSHRCE